MDRENWEELLTQLDNIFLDAHTWEHSIYDMCPYIIFVDEEPTGEYRITSYNSKYYLEFEGNYVEDDSKEDYFFHIFNLKLKEVTLVN